MNQTVAMPVTANPREVPGDLAMWFFILAELLVFGVFFLAYGYSRAHDPLTFAAGQRQLDLGVATVNTLLLIGGSASVAAAVKAFALDRQQSARRLLWLTLALGLGFVVLKSGEFAGKFSAGITLSSDTFWMFYLSLTFFHFLHVILGLVIVGAVAVYARDGRYRPGTLAGVETAAAYWHMIDLVWVVLFALVYVAR